MANINVTSDSSDDDDDDSLSSPRSSIVRLDIDDVRLVVSSLAEVISVFLKVAVSFWLTSDVFWNKIMVAAIVQKVWIAMIWSHTRKIAGGCV